MKSLLQPLLALLLIAAGAESMAQQVIQGKPGMWPTFISYQNNTPAFKQGIVSLPDINGKSSAVNGLRHSRTENDKNRQEHHRYEQTYNGIRIENAAWIVHTQKGRVISQNGRLVRELPALLPQKPALTEPEALQKALGSINASVYKWEIAAEESLLRSERNDPTATYRPKAELVYYSGERDIVPEALRLAYAFDIYAQEPLGRNLVFVDALNGNILGTRNLIHETNAIGSAMTGYSGTQTITTDYTGSLYRLRETMRSGSGTINTYDLQHGMNYANATDFTDADNSWNNANPNRDEYATDAHWGSEMTYDYFLQKHNRNSIDNAGFPLNSYVHFSTNYFNAFWDGYRMTYGDGNATNNYRPLTSLDVCGHEITHGITEHTSGLLYSNESGALNESFSDIFGTAIEWFARPGNADWLIGGDFYTIRSMSNPNTYNDPDTYEGTYWVSGETDYGGVHSNSGVLNFWFYLLCTGGSGTNDNGFNYAVTGIGMDKAAAIAYRLNAYYLVPTSGYYDARIYGIQAAEDLYGPGSPEAIQTANAFDAVGLYAPACSPAQNLQALNIHDHGATLSWSPVSGAATYRIQVKANYAAYWEIAGTTTDTFFTLQMLSHSTGYDWRVRPLCYGQYSESQFTTAPPACLAPQQLSAMITSDTAILEWLAANYATSYILAYKPAADSAWTFTDSTVSNSITISGLAANTTYDWHISSRCGTSMSDTAYGQFSTGVPACGTPQNLQTSFGPNFRTTMSWDPVPGASSYRLQFTWGGMDLNYAPIDVILTSNSFILDSLMSGTRFDWRVRAICPGNLSPYAFQAITTPCPASLNLTASNISATGITLNWSGVNTISGYGYHVYVKLSSAQTWSYLGNTMGTSYTYNNLQPGKSYDLQVKTSCQDINSNGIQVSVTTPCSLVPGNLGYSDLKTNSAKLTWGAIPGIVSYTVQYKKSSATTWTTVSGITTAYHTINTLSANTAYQFKVLALCSSGSSAYSSVAGFTTYCVSSGTNSNEWIDLFQLSNVNRTSGLDPGGYIHTGLAANLTIGSSGNTGQISAGFSGAVRTQMYAIYIDLNRNGSYADAGERVAGPTNLTTSGNFSFNFNIPPTATPGVTGMRVVLLRVASGVTMSPCLTGKRGETEDYFVNLSAPASILNTWLPAGDDQPETEKVSSSAAENTLQQVRVSPNPSSGSYRLDIPGDFEVSQYEVFNMTGTSILYDQIDNTQNMGVDLHQQPAGIYYLRLTSRDGRQEILKLVKY